MNENRGILDAPCSCGHTWGKHRGMPPHKCMANCDCPDFAFIYQTTKLALPIDLLLFCPMCATQHVDEAKPDVCEKCGCEEEFCPCEDFTAWLNPPHKSHRCTACNHVWRPADVPTNGVAELKTKGERDGEAKPSMRERDAWIETAARHARNEDYYRGLVQQIGAMLRKDAYISDDGSVQEDVLCAKVPELIAAVIERKGALLAALESVFTIADDAAKEWDKDNDVRVGKILLALSGRLKNYRADIDQIYAAVAQAKPEQSFIGKIITGAPGEVGKGDC